MRRIVIIMLLLGCYALKASTFNPINSMSQSLDQTYALIDLYAPKYPAIDPLYIENQTIALMQANTNINDLNPINGYTALHMAMTNLAIPYNLIALLLNYGALVYAQTLLGETALTLAARNDRSPDIINLLLTMGAANGSDPMHIEINGNTAMNYLLYNLKRHQLAGDLTAYSLTYTSINYLLTELSRNWFYSGTQANVQKSLIANGYYSPSTPTNTLSWLAYIGDINLMNQFIATFSIGIASPNYINQRVGGLTAFDWAQGNPDMLQLLRAYGGQKGVYKQPGIAPTQSRDIWAPLYAPGL